MVSEPMSQVRLHNVDVWFLNYRYSNHMSEKRQYLFDLNEKLTYSMKLGSNSTLVVNGKGNIRLKGNGNVSIICGVFYVPKLKNNLLSLRKLKYKGWIFCFNKGNAKNVLTKGLIINVYEHNVYLVSNIHLF